jgi:hypothetical protein
MVQITDQHELVWRHLPERRKKLDGAAKYIAVHRDNKALWVRLTEVTPAELSLLVGYAKTAESQRTKQINRMVELDLKKRRR